MTARRRNGAVAVAVVLALGAWTDYGQQALALAA
jgi:hypothetical protein